MHALKQPLSYSGLWLMAQESQEIGLIVVSQVSACFKEKTPQKNNPKMNQTHEM